MMSQRSKRELIEAIRPRYLKADKAGKEHILNEFVAASVHAGCTHFCPKWWKCWSAVRS